MTLSEIEARSEAIRKTTSRDEWISSAFASADDVPALCAALRIVVAALRIPNITPHDAAEALRRINELVEVDR